MLYSLGEREGEREREFFSFFLLSLVIFHRSIPALIKIVVINDKKNQLNKKNRQCEQKVCPEFD